MDACDRRSTCLSQSCFGCIDQQDLAKSWDINVFCQVALEYQNNSKRIEADEIIRCMDVARLNSRELTSKGFDTILLGIRQFSRNDRFNGDVLVGNTSLWANPYAQLELLQHAITSKSPKIQFKSGEARKKAMALTLEG